MTQSATLARPELDRPELDRPELTRPELDRPGPDAGRDPGTHPRHRLDELLVNGLRLSLVAALDSIERVEFALLRDALVVSDSALSKQLAALERAGYLRLAKGRVERRSCTWVSITPDGAAAYRAHLRAVRDIAVHDVTISWAAGAAARPVER